jgi:hypothetical protein
MLRWFIRRKIAAFEKQNGYDMSYARDMLDVDLAGFLKFARISALGEHRRDVPIDAFHATKLAGTLAEDCGPCTQLQVTMAERDGVPPEVLRAVLAGDVAAMPAHVALAFEFARASLAHDLAADELRDKIIARWGKRAVMSLAFGLAAARMFPTLKYALGHGRACARVTVAGAVAPLALLGRAI